MRLTLEQYRAIVGDREFFNFYTKTDHNGRTYYVGNYVSIACRFPPLDEDGIDDAERFARRKLRDLRGVIFNDQGEIISLPLHKFMNLGEGDEHQSDKLDWSSFTVYDKLDGSMVRPVNFYGDVRWCTKAGITHMSPDIEAYVARRDKKDTSFSLDGWVKDLLAAGLTPIFEYMAPQHRIVVDYGPEENMVLLAIRDIATGEYLDIHAKDDLVPPQVEVVRQWEVTDMESLLDTVRELKGAEGVIIKFKDGPWVKVKSLDYVILHKNRDSLEKERYVILNSVRETIDDLLPLLPPHLREKVAAYASSFMGYYNKRITEMAINIKTAYDAAQSAENPRKEFALNSGLNGREKSLTFTFWGKIGDNFESDLRDYLNDKVAISCDQSESNFQSFVAELFPDRPEWNIWKVEE
jgi:RNA ligase